MTDPGHGTARSGPAAAGIALAVLSAGTFGTSGVFASALISTGWSPAAVAIARLGGSAVLLGGFIIADLDARPPVAYLETTAEGHVTDSPSVAAHVALSFDRLRAGAESWATSRDLIRKVAEERWT